MAGRPILLEIKVLYLYHLNLVSEITLKLRISFQSSDVDR